MFQINVWLTKYLRRTIRLNHAGRRCESDFPFVSPSDLSGGCGLAPSLLLFFWYIPENEQKDFFSFSWTSTSDIHHHPCAHPSILWVQNYESDHHLKYKTKTTTEIKATSKPKLQSCIRFNEQRMPECQLGWGVHLDAATFVNLLSRLTHIGSSESAPV